jgi:hypothetical protein
MMIAAALFALALDAAACPRAMQPPDGVIAASSVGSAVYADFDEDGRTDVALVNGGDKVTVALARDGGVYEPVWTTNLHQYVYLTAATDTNRDGHVDLVFGLAVLLGAGDGTFREPLRGTPGNFASRLGAMRDFDRDGILDLIYWGDTDVFKFYRGTGEGGFELTTSYHLDGSAGPYPQLAVGDFDGDGNLDLVRSDGLRPGVQLLEIAWNDGNFHFTKAVFPGTATNPYVAPADVDGDGAEELLSQIDDSLHIHSFANRKFASTVSPFVRESVSEVTAMENVSVADMNGDGVRDLIFHLFQSVAIMTGTGQRTFSAPDIYNFVGPERYVLTDLDGDAFPDIAGTGGVNGLRLIRGADLQRDRVDARVYSVALRDPLVRMTDLNGDGIQDIVARDFGAERVSVAYGTRNGFEVVYRNEYPTGFWSATAAPIVGDFDGDGAPDLLLTQLGPNYGEPLLFFGDGKGGFPPSTKLTLDADFVVDAIRDGTGTAIVARKAGAVLLMRISAGRNVSTSTITTTAGVVSVVKDSADAPAIAVTDGRELRLFSRRDGTWSESLNIESPIWEISDIPLVTGDMNGDGLVDLVGVANGLNILYATGTGYTLLRPGLHLTLPDRTPGSIAVADVDGDGASDLVIMEGTFWNLQVMRNAGGGTFTPLASLTTGGRGGSQTMFADVDGDGSADLIRAAGHGLEVFRSVCATPVPIRVSTSAAVEGSPLRMVVQGIPARGFVGYVSVSEAGKPFVVSADRDMTATAVVMTPPLTVGTHTYKITFADQYLGSSSTEFTVTALPRRLRHRSAPH